MTQMKQPFHMLGTERTGLYYVPLVTDRARVGVRRVASLIAPYTGGNRIRVEPFDDEVAAQLAEILQREDDWKQPGDGGQNRFSLMVNNDLMPETVALATSAITAGSICRYVNPEIQKQFAHPALVAAVRTLNIPGANFASCWHIPTLVEKLR